MPDELWTEVCDIIQETGSKTILKKKKCKKAKWLSEEALQIAVKTREAKSKREKERNIHLNAEFQRIARSTRYDGELREPLVWRQGSQVSSLMLDTDLSYDPVCSQVFPP